MLTIEDLRVGYSKEKDVLKGICLSMETGKIHGLVGLNGAGKTTLLNALYSFIRPQSGTILYDGSPLKRKEIGYLESENYFYPYMTGNEYLNLFPSGGTNFDTESWQKLLSLPLGEITENYSTGMRKKLALLAVLKMNKPILILDEPYNGLDLESAHLLTLILSRLRENGKTVLVTSHIYETLTTVCDYIHYMKDGIIASSYPKERFGELQEILRTTVKQRADGAIEQLL